VDYIIDTDLTLAQVASDFAQQQIPKAHCSMRRKAVSNTNRHRFCTPRQGG